MVALSCASLLLGGGRAWWVAAPRTADHIAHHLSENRVDLYGVIAELPIQRRNAVMFTVEAERVFDQKRQVAVEVSGRILVKVYESWVYPRYGDRIVLRNVWPKRPANFNNPGEFV